MNDRLMTYAELAEFLGKSEEAARQFAKRKRWRRSISNEDGRARVSVPVEFLEQPRPPVDPRPDDEADTEQPPVVQVDDALGMVVDMLRERVEGLESELASARTALELERVRAGQAEILQALVVVERTRIEDLRAERDRWQAKADEALTALIERTAVVPRTDATAPPRGTLQFVPPSWWPFRRAG